MARIQRDTRATGARRRVFLLVGSIAKTGYQDRCLFVGRKKSIAGVWPKKACNYKTFRINGVAYETYENARRKSRTDNSNIVYKQDDTVEEFQAGRIESVLEVQVSHS